MREFGASWLWTTGFIVQFCYRSTWIFFCRAAIGDRQLPDQCDRDRHRHRYVNLHGCAFVVVAVTDLYAVQPWEACSSSPFVSSILGVVRRIWAPCVVGYR